MRLGKASAYAVLAVVHIAEHSDGSPIQGRDIADACNLPAGHLLKILQQLVRTQILISERGPSGGFTLRRAPEKITLLEIIEAIDGPITADLRISDQVKGKNRAKAGVTSACTEIAKFARSVLSDATVSDLID